MERSMVVEPRVAVVGVGGAGCNIVSDVYWNHSSAFTIAINTDKDALATVHADRKAYICKAVTRGHGTRGDSILGKRCAQAHVEEIEEALKGHDIAFIIAGLGGGTGTGGAPVVAEIAQRLGMITFVIAIDPFSFETARTTVAKEGLIHLRAACPMTVVVENDKAMEKYPDATLRQVFRAVNRSITGYVMRMTSKVSKMFEAQLGDIDELKEDRDAFPDMRSTDGILNVN